MPLPVIIDTNVVVSGLLTSIPDAPTALILDGMLGADFPYLMSIELMAEYRTVLLRPKIQQLHSLSPTQVDVILKTLATNGIFRDLIAADSRAPDSNDQHLWDLLETTPHAILVTGDRQLQHHAPATHPVLSPTEFITRT
jgi:uncharacterized protein